MSLKRRRRSRLQAITHAQQEDAVARQRAKLMEDLKALAPRSEGERQAAPGTDAKGESQAALGTDAQMDGEQETLA